MLRSLRRMSPGGDTTIAEWDTETVTPERLKEIETEYDRLVSRGGMTPVDITDKRDEIIQGGFKPEADILLLPRMQGGGS